MSVLSTFGIDANIFGSMITEPDILESNSRTTMLRKDKEVAYKGSINGVSVDAFVTLREAALTRLSLLQQQSRRNNSDYWLVTGVMQPVRIDIDLLIDGERIAMVDLFHKIACDAAGKEITRDEFLMNARKIGLNYVDGQPLFFQQFGANFDNFKELIEHFKAAGAEDVLADIKGNTGRIKAAYQLKPGMPITAFEIGTVNREESARFKFDSVGQGFLNLIDSQFDQLTRILGLRKSAKINRTLAENTDLSEDEIRKLRAQADLDMKMSRQAVSNWAGAQKRIVQLKNGGFDPQNQYDPVNAPCGRLTVITANGTPYEADLWTNKKSATSTGTPATTTPVDYEMNGEEEPF